MIQSQESMLAKLVAKSASGTFLLRIFYLLSGFASTILLTRWLGAEGLGVYNFVISWIVLAVIFVKFGFEDYMTREIAALRSAGDIESVKSLWEFVRRFTLITSCLAGLLYLLLVTTISIETPHLQRTFLLGIILIPLLATLGIYRGLFRGTKNIISSQVPEYLIRPAQTLLLIGAMLVCQVQGMPEYAMLITVLGALTALLFCAFRNPVSREISGADICYTPRRTWLAGAFPFLLIAGIHVFNQRTDRLMLGSMMNMKSVGFYAVAIQLSLVVNFPLVGITAAIGPLVAERQEPNARKELQAALKQSSLVATLIAALIVGALVSLGPEILNILGPEFQESYAPMIILAVGQLANVASGPAGAILSMSRHERLVAIGVFVSAILNVILNYFFIPTWGIVGAAVATATAMVCWNIVLVIAAKRKLGIDANFAAFLVPSKIAL